MSVALAQPVEPPPSQEEIEGLRRLVRGIVLAQGNLFIKELLRSRKIKIGATKAEFESNLLQAIDEGRLRLADLSAWLDEVEGWVDQHVYLFKVPATVQRRPLWSSADKVRASVRDAGLEELWNRETSLLFPAEPVLTGVSFDAASRVLRLIWHEGSLGWVRVPERDRREEIDGDLYEFRAYRQRASRAVMRFEVRLQTGLAALFLSARINDPEHEVAVEEAQSRSNQLFNLSELWQNPVIIANVIKNLDQATGKPDATRPAATPESVRLAHGGAYVEFASLSVHRSYLESEAVRDARLAIKRTQLEKFIGLNGSFEFPKDADLSRDVRVQLFGETRRIRLWQQMKAPEVWRILEILGGFQ
jgi:hypothetical protein